MVSEEQGGDIVAYTQESLHKLKEKIDLVELLSSYLPLKKNGAHYKGLCPFHNEKSPSFLVQRGDKHYHCFGCGAHGDAIAFLMTYLHVTFVEAIELLSEKFDVPLEKMQGKAEFVESQKVHVLKDILNKVSSFYHHFLLHTDEGKSALQYLYQRGIDLDFIQMFQIGLAPKEDSLFLQAAYALAFTNEQLVETGLLKTETKRTYFHGRITIPIVDLFGNVIGFSCRKLSEKEMGPKYINTPETILFKKSKVLFGLKESRRTIAKEKKAIIVEGQIDALRLIQEGFNYTLSAGGTAFGEDHVKELVHLGVEKVYLAFDGDEAGRNATQKAGQLLQKKGVEVFVLLFEKGEDPDSTLLAKGGEAFQKHLDESIEYLPFLLQFYSSQINSHTPAGKNEIVKRIMAQIKEWEHPLMIHEATKKVAEICEVPLDLIQTSEPLPLPVMIKKEKSSLHDPNRFVEMTLLQILIISSSMNQKIASTIALNVLPSDFIQKDCGRLYATVTEELKKEGKLDWLSLMMHLQKEHLDDLFVEITSKKVQEGKLEEASREVMNKMLIRNWMMRREEIKNKIQTNRQGDEEALNLAKQFDELKLNPPVLKEIT